LQIIDRELARWAAAGDSAAVVARVKNVLCAWRGCFFLLFSSFFLFFSLLSVFGAVFFINMVVVTLQGAFANYDPGNWEPAVINICRRLASVFETDVDLFHGLQAVLSTRRTLRPKLSYTNMTKSHMWVTHGWMNREHAGGVVAWTPGVGVYGFGAGSSAVSVRLGISFEWVVTEWPIFYIFFVITTDVGSLVKRK
jgi:hypothetical protein